jgi:putative DNA primase/helicase
MTDVGDNIIRLIRQQDQDQQPVLSEDAVALEFAGAHQGRLLFDHDTGTWFQWDGAHWRQERTMLAFDFCRALARQLSDTGKRTVRTRLGRASFASAVERFAQADRAFAITSDSWDTDAFLLGTPVGTVALRNGTLRLSDPADRISKMTAVGPAETADCPRWLAFLDETTGGDAAMVRFLKQWCGYCLTGNIREHQLVFIVGPGQNGKSVFLNTISGIMNDYAVTASIDTFTVAKHDRHPCDLAMLRGARIVTAAETEEGRSWATSRVKQLTGGDAISARFMNQNFFTYVPTFKLMIVGNHLPNLVAVDDAERRRINVVPFVLKPKEPDKNLTDKLRREWPGILRWMIEGTADWLANELTPAPAVVDATRDYFDNQDLVAQWLEEKCDAEPGNEFKTATSGALFTSWSAFAKAAGEDPGTRKGFVALLKRRQLRPTKRNGVRLWLGVRLKPEGYDEFRVA